MSSAAVGNDYPIVLVHGFAGWGREELIGLKYWGGIQGDLQEQLRARGHTVFTATVGPFSSNWDRACELYAQIKGGRVDYGANHSKTHGHARFGRTFPGLYPQWGEGGADGAVRKVHLIGHSMGGQTIRMLTQLLNKGAANAPVPEEAPNTHPLFAGGKDWVHSITTISTPNQGALLANAFHGAGELIKDTVAALFSSLNLLGDWSDELYDAKLDQWGISPKAPGESLRLYLDRVFDSPIFAPGVKDISLWSVSTSGAAEDSGWIETLANVFYFSYATDDTHASRDLFFRRIQKPNLFTMFLPLQPLASFLGGRYAPEHGFSEEWQANDGIVNSISMCNDAVGEYVPFTNVAKCGVWNGMPSLEPMDHIAVIGLTIHTNVLETLYAAHATLLKVLPASGEATAAHEQLQHDAGECVHTAAASLCALAVAAAADKAAGRGRAELVRDAGELAGGDGRISLVTWGPSSEDEAVKPIPVFEQEP